MISQPQSHFLGNFSFWARSQIWEKQTKSTEADANLERTRRVLGLVNVILQFYNLTEDPISLTLPLEPPGTHSGTHTHITHAPDTLGAQQGRNMLPTPPTPLAHSRAGICYPRPRHPWRIAGQEHVTHAPDNLGAQQGRNTLPTPPTPLAQSRTGTRYPRPRH